jgi:hypothetical protein
VSSLHDSEIAVLQFTLSDLSQFDRSFRDQVERQKPLLEGMEDFTQLSYLANFWLQTNYTDQHVAFRDDFTDTEQGLRLVRSIFAASHDLTEFGRQVDLLELADEEPPLRMVYAQSPDYLTDRSNLVTG